MVGPASAMLDPHVIEWEFYGPLIEFINGLWVLVL
jgi:hypothetical protein